MKWITTFLLLALVAGTAMAAAPKRDASSPLLRKKTEIIPVTRTDEDWRQRLTPDQYRVLREKGTERAFTGAYWNHHASGTYVCAACGLELFGSDTKFDSGSGWPSYWQPLEKNHVKEISDRTLGMVRTEVECARCGGHLGHVFEDGPRPTGLRYCINSVSLGFKPKK